MLTLVPDGRYDFLSGSSLAAASVSGGSLCCSRAIAIWERRTCAICWRARAARWPCRRAKRERENLCAAMAALMHQPECKE